MATRKMTAIRGSMKQPLPNARVVAPAPSDERFEVTLRLRPRTPLPKATTLLSAGPQPLSIMTPEAYERAYGADPKDFAPIRRFARANGLTVVRESSARRSAMLAGTVAAFNRAFGVSLQTYEYPGGTYRGRTGPVRIPASLASVVEGVFGLDNRPAVKRHRPTRAQATSAAGGARAFNPNELASIYNFPAGVDGTGQTIGIIELGGGYRPADLQAYFQNLNLPLPMVIPVSVDGGSNAPSTANSDDPEVALDIEVAFAVAPGARIVVYFAPNDATSKGFLDALTKAVHDTQYTPAAISISWGGPEQKPGDSFQTQFDQVLQAAALLGITVCVAAGDNGAADVGPNAWDGKPHVDFPGASPFALCCGGTRLLTAGQSISAESIWNQHAADTSAAAGPDGSFGAGGGGVSGAFALPSYQQNVNVPASLNPSGFRGRGLPDVSADGDPATGYNILVDGQAAQYGGTSAVAPLWAGLIARINQKLGGRVGFIHPQIYSLPSSSGAFHDVSVGDNRVSFKNFQSVGYDASSGWDPCSGLGSPDGAKLAGVLKPATMIGVPPQRKKRRRVPAAARKSRAKR